jgi:hypothetical protein
MKETSDDIDEQRASDTDNDEDEDEGEDVQIPFEIEYNREDGSIYTALDIDKAQIRLLRIKSSPCSQRCADAPIVCTDLYKVSLDDLPNYAALSYV